MGFKQILIGEGDKIVPAVTTAHVRDISFSSISPDKFGKNSITKEYQNLFKNKTENKGCLSRLNSKEKNGGKIKATARLCFQKYIMQGIR